MSADILAKLNLRHVINASGTMTGLGASIVGQQSIQSIADILGNFVEIDDLQRRASKTIAELTGAECGFITASCSAGITLSIAALMTGNDLGAIEQLPNHVGPKSNVIMQMGHMVNYGAPVDQAVRLSGARVVPIGQATSASAFHLASAINENTLAALYVVSHHTVEYGQIPFKTFAAVAHEHNVPVIVDAASEYDLTGFIRDGADIVLYSGHKFLGGPTSGIVAGRKDIVRNIYLQNRGIGRGMKVGKEGIAGAIAALEAWKTRDHAAIRAREKRALDLWYATLNGRPGVSVRITPDPTHNPLDRLRIDIDRVAAHITAWDLVDRLAKGAQPIVARDHEVEHGYFFLDPCNLQPDQEQIVAARLAEELDIAQKSNDLIATPFEERTLNKERAILNWPD